MKIKSLLVIGIAIGGIISIGCFTPAQTATLLNGDSNTNNLTNGALRFPMAGASNERLLLSPSTVSIAQSVPVREPPTFLGTLAGFLAVAILKWKLENRSVSVD